MRIGAVSPLGGAIVVTMELPLDAWRAGWRSRAQGFADPRPTGRVDRRHVRRVLDRVGLIQIDSVNVLVRSQELPLFARLGPHPRDLLPKMLDAGELFEYWAHEASLLPIETLPWFRWTMDAKFIRWPGLRRMAEEHPDVVERGARGGHRTRPDRAERHRRAAKVARARGGAGTTPSARSRCSSRTGDLGPAAQQLRA